jgi:hypothetical protein
MCGSYTNITHFHTWDWSTCEFWYLWGLLESILWILGLEIEEFLWEHDVMIHSKQLLNSLPSD